MKKIVNILILSVVGFTTSFSINQAQLKQEQIEITKENQFVLQAIKTGNVATLQQFVKEGFKVTQRNHECVVQGLCGSYSSLNSEQRLNILNLLMLAGLNAKDYAKSFDDLLHKAVVCDDVRFAQKLLQHGARIDTKDVWDWAPLDHALYYKVSDTMINMLISHGGQVNRTYKKGCYSPLIYRISPSVGPVLCGLVFWPLLLCLATEDTVSDVQFLIQHGVDVNQQDLEYKWTPLHWAVYKIRFKDGHAREKYQKIIKMLLCSGADVHIKDYKGLTPLDYAHEYQQSDVVDLLNNK